MGNPVVHWQLLVKDPDASAAFYAELFDWKVDGDNPLGYRRFDSGNDKGIDGGVWPAPPEAPSFVQLHVEVDDADEHLERATALGARVVMPPQAMPEGGRMAVLCDPEGIPFVLFQAAR